MMQQDDKDYRLKVYAETDYRINNLGLKKCTCFKYQQELETLQQFYDKISGEMYKKPGE